MTIHSRERDRIVGSRGGNGSGGRELFSGPQVLVPCAPQNPFSWFRRLRGDTDSIGDLLFGGNAAQIQIFKGVTQAADMPVRIDQTRNYRGAMGFDHFGGRANEAPHIVSDRNNRSAPHSQCGGPRMLCVESINIGPGHGKVGRLSPGTQGKKECG